MTRCLTVATAVALVLLGAMPARAKPKAKENRRGDEKAVRASVASFEAAFNKGDAKALAAHWLPDGDLVTASGEMVKGREAIQRQFELFLAERGRPKLKSTIISIRFLAPDVAVEDATSRLDPPPAGPPIHAHHTTIYVKREGKWLIASARGAVSFPPSNYDHLKELEWMVGTWALEGESGAGHIHTTCRWSENKNYLVREVRAELHDQISVSGTVRIGWDPRQKKIKSWVFENDGSLFQGTWTRQGNRWLVEESGTLQDGTEASAVNILTPIDADTFQFQSVRRKLGGQPEPDIGPLQLKRTRGRR